MSQDHWIVASALGACLGIAGCGADSSEPGGGDDAAADDDDDGDGDGTGGVDDGGSGSDDGVAAAPTYWQDVKPLLDARCVSCHVDGGVTPFALDTYQAATMYAPAAQASVHAGVMPPWPPTDDCRDYVASRALDDGESELIDAWIDAGMPEGDPAAEGPPMDVERLTLSRVDLAMEMTVDYTPQQTPDDYRCFVLPWPEEYTETVYVTGSRAVPGNPATVHHIIAFLAPPDAAAEYQALDDAEEGAGYTCFGATNGSVSGSVGGWAPGNLGSDLPDGLGIAVDPGSMIILQVHYNTLSSGEPGPDRSGIELKIDTEVEKRARTIPMVNPAWLSPGGMMIPAGEKDVVHAASMDPTLFVDWEGLTIHTALLHMHLLGTSARMTIEHADGSEECLLAIDDWDFGWQDFYRLRQPAKWRAGDKFGIECHYDNSPENQPMVDGERLEPRDVQWGEGTTDEMCIGFMLVTEE